MIDLCFYCLVAIFDHKIPTRVRIDSGEDYPANNLTVVEIRLIEKGEASVRDHSGLNLPTLAMTTCNGTRMCSYHAYAMVIETGRYQHPYPDRRGIGSGM